MSIENNIKRIADALEYLIPENSTNTGDHLTAGIKVPKTTKTTKTTRNTEQVEGAALQLTNEIVDTSPPVAPPLSPPVIATVEELNEALVIEFNRLGARDSIDRVMADFGITSVYDLQFDQYQPLLDTVKAIKP